MRAIQRASTPVSFSGRLYTYILSSQCPVLTREFVFQGACEVYFEHVDCGVGGFVESEEVADARFAEIKSDHADSNSPINRVCGFGFFLGKTRVRRAVIRIIKIAHLHLTVLKRR